MKDDEVSKLLEKYIKIVEELLVHASEKNCKHTMKQFLYSPKLED